MSQDNTTYVPHLTIDGPLKYIINDDDSLNVMFMKAFFALQMLRIFIFGMKALSLYVIYNGLLRMGFKELPSIKYIQIIILLVSIEMVKNVVTDSKNESE